MFMWPVLFKSKRHVTIGWKRRWNFGMSSKKLQVTNILEGQKPKPTTAEVIYYSLWVSHHLMETPANFKILILVLFCKTLAWKCPRLLAFSFFCKWLPINFISTSSADCIKKLNEPLNAPGLPWVVLFLGFYPTALAELISVVLYWTEMSQHNFVSETSVRGGKTIPEKGSDLFFHIKFESPFNVESSYWLWFDRLQWRMISETLGLQH